MKSIRIVLFARFLVAMSVLVLSSAPVFGQARCMTDEEAKRVINLINTPGNVTENKNLTRELLSMQEAHQKLEQKINDNWKENQKLIPSMNELSEKHFLRLCEIIKQYGWLRKELVGEEGAAAALYLMRGNKSVVLQRELFPVVVAAAEKGYVGKNHLATLIDNIRVRSGMAQIFGTQTWVKDELFYLFPLLNESKVDEWRKLYNLPPLASFIKYVQSQYQTVVIKPPRAVPVPLKPKEKKQTAETAAPANTTANQILNLEEDEVVEKVESNLVNLNVRVSAGDSTNADLNLQKNDFLVLENGKEQEISFFSATDAPFDLVLLLDLSGSTAGKQDLIRKSTQRFIEAARPSDRIAIVTFAGEPEIISDLTQDRQKLLKNIKNIRGGGGSAIWMALEFALETIIKPQSQGRRSAILIMTDGVDSSLLPGSLAYSSSPTFTELLESVRSYDTTIIPIYLDTETKEDDWIRKAYRSARRTLEMIAEESGGQMYQAKKVEDLNGVYEKVIGDLGKVYSLGYQSADETRDGSWRKLTVKIPSHPTAVVRTRPGYYAK